MKYFKWISSSILFLFILSSTGCVSYQDCTIDCDCNGTATTTFSDYSEPECEDAREEFSDELNCDCSSEWGD